MSKKLQKETNNLKRIKSSSEIIEENLYEIGDISVLIREFSFHRLNGNQVWPGNQIFADFLMNNLEVLKGKRVLELGSGSGILSIFLSKKGISITASDCPDNEVLENIEYNCKLNQIDPVPIFPRNN